jgi:hypothetical protein
MHVSRVPLPYTAERANRVLPLVRRIVDDLVASYDDWQDAVSRFEYATSRARADAPDAEAERLQKEAHVLAAQIEGFVAELDQLGVECRAFDTGLVDFPGELEGRPVYFCWMKGEAAVGHWHEVEAGFGGRQPLNDSDARRVRGDLAKSHE